MTLRVIEPLRDAAMGVIVLLTLTVGAAPLPALASGTNTAQLVADSYHVPVSVQCVTSNDLGCSACFGAIPLLKASIQRYDPPTGIFASCDAVDRGMIYLLDRPFTLPVTFPIRLPDLGTPDVYFELNRPLCSFGPSNYVVDYNPSNYIVDSTCGRIASACEVRTTCRQQRQPTTIARYSLVKLDRGTQTVGVATAPPISVTFDCPSCSPLVGPASIPAEVFLAGSPFSIPTASILRGGYPPVRYSVVGSPLPSGISLDPNTGQLHGTMRLASLDVTVKAVDSCPYGSQQASTVFEMGTECPQVRLQTQALLPDALNGSTYRYPLQHEGLPPFTFRLVAGALPPGLTLNPRDGTISGTIQAARNNTAYEFTVLFQDDCWARWSRTQTFSIRVRNR